MSKVAIAVIVEIAIGCGPAPRPPEPIKPVEVAEPIKPVEVAEPDTSDEVVGADEATDAPDPTSDDVRRRPRRASKPAPAEPPVALPASVVDRVYFSENNAALEEVVDALDAFARVALDDRKVTLVLVARADSTERDPNELSERRASVVRSYLIGRGVPASRIRTMAVGSHRPPPVGSGNESATNRSVELATEVATP